MIVSSKVIKKAKNIKLIATDVDGVWTDSKMYYSKEGVFMKSFSTYGGMGASVLLKHKFISVVKSIKSFDKSFLRSSSHPGSIKGILPLKRFSN